MSMDRGISSSTESPNAPWRDLVRADNASAPVGRPQPVSVPVLVGSLPTGLRIVCSARGRWRVAVPPVGDSSPEAEEGEGFAADGRVGARAGSCRPLWCGRRVRLSGKKPKGVDHGCCRLCRALPPREGRLGRNRSCRPFPNRAIWPFGGLETSRSAGCPDTRVAHSASPF
jgi:hypothetical protein